MNVCEFCGKTISKCEEFVLVGKYPSMVRTWFRSAVVRWAPPECYGKIYHKTCFLEMCRKRMENKHE